MDTELVWFEEGNWSHQKDATHIIFRFKICNTAIVKIIKDYMESIGMKAKNIDEFAALKMATKSSRKGSLHLAGVCVDMVNKEFWVLNRHDYNNLVGSQGYYVGYPSQVIEFTTNNVGRLTGKKFGL